MRVYTLGNKPKGLTAAWDSKTKDYHSSSHCIRNSQIGVRCQVLQKSIRVPYNTLPVNAQLKIHF